MQPQALLADVSAALVTFSVEFTALIHESRSVTDSAYTAAISIAH